MISVTTTKQVPLAELVPYARNPRNGDTDAIAESLRAHGQYRAIVVRAGTNEVLAGNHTLHALFEIGASHALCHYVEVDDEQAARIVLVDNRSNDLAGYNDAELLELLQDLPDLEGTGYDQRALEKLVAQVGAELDPEGGGIPDVPADATTRPGDLYVMGEHRLLCGDSSSASDVARLMGGGTADVLFTDPPYGISYRDVKGKHRAIANDAAEPSELVRDAIALFGVGDVPAYVCCDWRSLPAMLRALGEAGVEPKATLVWDKDRGVQNLDRYFKQYELIVYAGPYGGETTLRGDVWRFPREPNPGDHPTPKPVDLIAQALRDAGGSSVADPFAGSGSTLIAAEGTGHACYAMELDPAYCDVIVKRWEAHTGKTAELVRDG